MNELNPIPVSAAKWIAEQYGYDQVIVIARRVGEDPDPHGEHVTTYGRDKTNCEVAASIGAFLKFKVMGWVEETRHEPAGRALLEGEDRAIKEDGNG